MVNKIKELEYKRIYLKNNYEIREYSTNKVNIIALFSNNAFLSFSFLDNDLKFDLCNNYLKLYDLPNYLYKEGNNYLVLGGGTFSYPKYYIKNYKDKKMTVVEIDKYCIDLSKKYFFLDELYKTYDSNNERLNIIIDDAIKYINTCTIKYDYILLDLFYGEDIVKEAYTQENLKQLKKLLKDKGIIIINYIINDNNYIRSKKELYYLTTITKYHKFITLKENYDFNNNIGNVLGILSDEKIEIPSILNTIDITNIILKRINNFI